MDPHYLEHLSPFEYNAIMRNELVRQEVLCLLNQFNRKEYEQVINKQLRKKRLEKLPGTKFDVSKYHQLFDSQLQK